MTIQLGDAVADFNRNRHQIFEAVLEALVAARHDVTSADFANLLNTAQSALGLTELEMSHLFKVSRPTVNRWTRGVTAPHPLLRKAVFDSLISKLKGALKLSR